MADHPHYSNFETLTEAVAGFAAYARANGLNCGIGDTNDALRVASDQNLIDREYMRHGLKALFCSGKEDIELFDSLFDMYWHTGAGLVKSKTTYKNQSNIVRKSNSSVVMLGEGRSDGELKDAKSTSGANAAHRLRKTDFSKISEIDSRLLEELALKLWRQMSRRLKRRMKSANRGYRIDLRKTMRRNIAHGGDLIELRMRRKALRKQRLIVILDVSGSMDKYSYFLLRFVWALRSHFESVESFIFSTSLIRITDYLDTQNLEATLEELSAKANNWSSGTKIGECFEDFNERFGKQVLNGRSSVIVLSDGLDTGDPDILRRELKKIRLRTRRVIWLNPLKGMANYEPIQKGMSTALEEVDAFKSAHNLDSLLELENILTEI